MDDEWMAPSIGSRVRLTDLGWRSLLDQIEWKDVPDADKDDLPPRTGEIRDFDEHSRDWEVRLDDGTEGVWFSYAEIEVISRG